ncbi:MAG TPA: hypothetical protein VFC19_51240 [Candidatus Limnocylindrales bacterium]|nr:hypothetical protein [Candidatus Limnocylindrales bacterium]
MKHATATGLSAKDLTLIRETLAAGKRPRIVFTENAGQIAGQFGHVVQLEDPKANDDWILVKFGADVLPFPPSDLAIAPRGAAAKKAAEPPAPPAKKAPPEPEFKVVRETAKSTPSPAPRQETTVTDSDKPAKTTAKAEKAVKTDKASQADKPSQAETTAETTAETPAADSATTGAAGTSAAPAPRKPTGAARGAKAKPLPSFTVTLSYAEGEWSVGAVQGSKTVAKPYVVKPTEALKMVSMLDVPGVHEAVEQIVSAERAQTQAHAEKLRAELAELEAKLAELGTV